MQLSTLFFKPQHPQQTTTTQYQQNHESNRFWILSKEHTDTAQDIIHKSLGGKN